MTTTVRRPGKFKMYLTEITLAFNEAPQNRGVPPIKSVVDKYEVKLSGLYDKLEQLAVEYDA